MKGTEAEMGSPERAPLGTTEAREAWAPPASWARGAALAHT